MKTAGIVAEFDPFHNGHKYLVKRARENGAQFVVSVMSGSFLQRGSCAVLGKYERAEAAVLGGVDLVLELPQVFACASAETFARGGVGVLKACGCVDTLCCGAEYLDGKVRWRALDILEGADVRQFLIKGYSYPRAVFAAVERSGDLEAAKLFRSPNDVLALEYLKAGRDDFDFLTVRRTAPHDGDIPAENGVYPACFGVDDRFISASAIRKMMISGDDTYKEYVPETTARIIEKALEGGRCPASFENNERGVLSVLRRMTADELRELPDVSEGLENRLYKAIRSENTVSDIIMNVKCKRYTYARLARIVACAYLGIKKSDITKPMYIRVLAFNDKGARLLKEMKTKASLPVVMSARDIKTLDSDARRMIDIDIRANDLFGLCTPAVMPCGEDYYTGALKIDDNGR